MEQMRINYSSKIIISNFIINECIVLLSIVLCACGKTHNTEYEYRMYRALEDYQYIFWVAPQTTDDLIEWLGFQRDDIVCKIDPLGNDFLTWLKENRSKFSIEVTDSTIVWSSKALGYYVNDDRRYICDLLYAERFPRNEIEPCAIEAHHRLVALEPSLEECLWQHQQQLNNLIRMQVAKEPDKLVVRRAYQYEHATNILSDFCTGETICGEEYYLIIPFVEQILLKKDNISTLRFTMYIPNDTIAD